MSNLLVKNKYQLAWDEYGVPNGEPVFYFHGTPGSRLEAQPADKVARELGLRLIAPDRPGYGGSEQRDDFGLLDWPGAVSQLADQLNLKRFSILAFSGGGPYALACAHLFAERINRISLVASSAPFETQVMQSHVNADFKPLYELSVADKNAAIELILQLASSPEALLDTLMAPLPPCDKALFRQNHFQNDYLENLTLSIHTGVNGIVNDLRNLTLPWQFNLDEIRLPIDIWHGRNDLNFGDAIGEYLANKLKNSSPHFLENSGHYFLFNKWYDVLKSCKAGRGLV